MLREFSPSNHVTERNILAGVSKCGYIIDHILCVDLVQHALNSGSAVGQRHEAIDLVVALVTDIVIAAVCGRAHGGGITVSHMIFLD